jgi:flagellar hook-basal body complex protein FliE
MTEIPSITVSPAVGIDAYRKAAAGLAGGGSPVTFGAVLEQTLSKAVETGRSADTQAVRAISGEGNLTEVVTALSRAEMTLQTVTAVRDRVVQAYQDIMKMPI